MQAIERKKERKKERVAIRSTSTNPAKRERGPYRSASAYKPLAAPYSTKPKNHTRFLGKVLPNMNGTLGFPSLTFRSKAYLCVTMARDSVAPPQAARITPRKTSPTSVMFSSLSLRVDDDFVFLRNDYSKHCSEKDMDRIHL